MMRFLGGSFVLLLLAGAALADQLDPALVGTWSGVEFTMTFQVQPSGACAIMDQQGTCAASGGRLRFTAPTGERAEYHYSKYQKAGPANRN